MKKETLVDYINEGLSTRQIAKKENTSQTNTRYWIKKYGLKTNPEKIQETKIEKDLNFVQNVKLKKREQNFIVDEEKKDIQFIVKIVQTFKH
jgi:transposase